MQRTSVLVHNYMSATADFCHGVPGVDKGGNIRNLGYSDSATIANLKDIVFLKGPFMSLGMPDFTGRLSEDDVREDPGLSSRGRQDAVRPKK